MHLGTAKEREWYYKNPRPTGGRADAEVHQEILLRKHFTVIIRQSKCQDISAACGQLRARSGEAS